MSQFSVYSTINEGGSAEKPNQLCLCVTRQEELVQKERGLK